MSNNTGGLRHRLVGFLKSVLERSDSQELRVRNKDRGSWQISQVRPLQFRGHKYLIAPVPTAPWVYSLRSVQKGELLSATRLEHFTTREITGTDKIPLLRAYLAGSPRMKLPHPHPADSLLTLSGLTANASDEQLLTIAENIPVFEIRPL